MTNEDALQLAVNCPWLDKKVFSPSDFTLQEVTAAPPTKRFTIADGMLHYAGPIDEQFEEIVRKNTFTTLALTSEGGDVDVALRVGKYIRSRSLNVNVEGDCLSACVWVVPGGIERTITPPGRIGGHQFHSKTEMTGDEGIEAGQQVTSEIAAYLQEMGVDQRLLQDNVARWIQRA